MKDKANLFARVGVGYATVAQHVASIRSVLRDGPLTQEEQLDMARELRGKRRLDALRSFVDVVGRDIPVPRQDSDGGSGVAGLAVVMGHGELLPLTVRIVPNAPKLVGRVTAVRQTYWSSYVERYDCVEKEYPISFGDYGQKDIFMQVSAIEAYKWLCNAFPTNMAGKGIRVEFQSLFANKGGPSAGAAMAVSAYSALMGKPVSRSVAMTGAITSDGAVHAIGGVFEKIMSAADSDGIETVLVPKGNEPDLLFIPLEQLCRVCIVVGGDLATYVNMATNPEYDKHELDGLRRAQILIRLGRFKEAEPLLLKVAATCPEMYSARRLLELLNAYGKLDKPDATAAIEIPWRGTASKQARPSTSP